MKTLRTKVAVFDKGFDLIEYKEGFSIVMASEFCIFNLGDKNIELQLNGGGDVLVLEPGEGFETKVDIHHAVVLTDGAIIKYSYWI